MRMSPACEVGGRTRRVGSYRVARSIGEIEGNGYIEMVKSLSKVWAKEETLCRFFFRQIDLNVVVVAGGIECEQAENDFIPPRSVEDPPVAKFNSSLGKHSYSAYHL